MVVLAATIPCGPALASEEVKVSELDLSQPAAAATVERMCEVAAQNIARHYNLNDKQAEFTNELMKREVSEFLKEHEEEIWPVIRELLARKLQAPEGEEDLKRIGKVSRKLAKRAKDTIFRANEQWRDILTEEQKKLHDFDLAEMEQTFGQIDDNFAAWEKGQHTDKPIFGERVRHAGVPRPRKPADGKLPTGEKDIWNPTIFDTFVEEFIKDCGLDAAQIEAARSILKEVKAQADDFQNAKKSEFAKIESERNKALAKGDIKGIKKANQDSKKLLEPIYQLFAQMESRLKNLLTTKQLERYNKTQKTTEPEPKIAKKREMTPKKEPLKKKTASATKGRPDAGKAGAAKIGAEGTDKK